MHSTMEKITIKMAMLRQFCVFYGTLKFPELASNRSKRRRYRSTSLKISAIGLKFSGVMHITMKQVATLNDYTRPIFARSMKLWIFPW